MKIFSLVIFLLILFFNVLFILLPKCYSQDLYPLGQEGRSSALLYTEESSEIISEDEFQNITLIISETSMASEDSVILVAKKRDEAPVKESDVKTSNEAIDTIPDPLEPINRVFFQFNDRLYFWVLKPVATGYREVVPEDLRIGIRNFFSNLTTPIRVANCILQFNFKCVGTETFRFVLNSTLGLAGFLDPAKKEIGIEKKDEDFGQTLGFWGIGSVLYIEWPILGASCLRDTIGYAGDLFLDPQNYLIHSIPLNLGIRSYERVNDTSLRIGEYEDFIKFTVDPYIAKRDAYYQNRQHKIKER